MLTWTSLLGQFVYHVGWGENGVKGANGRDLYFSQLQVSLYKNPLVNITSLSTKDRFVAYKKIADLDNSASFNQRINV